jgi:hypothetical protein
MVKHGMIDTETLAVGNDAVVLTIGAVKFNPFEENSIAEKLHLKLNTSEQIEKGRRVDEDTLAWWGKQDKEVRDAAFSEDDRVTVSEALDIISKWTSDINKIWCQGPSFDFPLMYDLYSMYEKPVPWKFWLERDSRTVTGLIPENIKEKIDFSAHNAVDDCIAQAKCVQYVYKKLNINHTF